MKLIRALVDGAPRVLVRSGEQARLATVQGRAFEDLPPLLAAAGGSPAGIEAGAPVTVADGALLSAVGRPGKVVCIGLNYRLHAAESGAPIPQHPMLFAKWATSLAGPVDDVEIPPESAFVDWESELAFVFGVTCRRVPAHRAADVVFGYTVANDVSMRDYQNHTSQFTAGKAWDRSTPIGPAVVPLAEAGGITPDLTITGRLNGTTVQASATSDLIFGIPELVAYITTVMTMEPGDVVLTGTPSGVGFASDPPRSLRDGDVFEAAVEGLGSVRNRFIAAPGPTGGSAA